MLSKLQEYDEENLDKSTQLLTKLLDRVTSPGLISAQPDYTETSTQRFSQPSESKDEKAVSMSKRETTG